MVKKYFTCSKKIKSKVIHYLRVLQNIWSSDEKSNIDIIHY